MHSHRLIFFRRVEKRNFEYDNCVLFIATRNMSNNVWELRPYSGVSEDISPNFYFNFEVEHKAGEKSQSAQKCGTSSYDRSRYGTFWWYFMNWKPESRNCYGTTNYIVPVHKPVICYSYVQDDVVELRYVNIFGRSTIAIDLWTRTIACAETKLQ